MSKTSQRCLRTGRGNSIQLLLRKKLGCGVATLIKDDIKSVFVNIQSNLEAISNLDEINGKQILIDNVYIPPSDSEMLYKLDLELEKYTMIFHCCYLVNLMPDIQLGIKIVKHLTKIVKFWNTL